MCNDACIEFGLRNIADGDVRGKHILEIGALNVNGSLRQSIAAHAPASYLGIDIEKGPGVDEICDIGDLVARYGEARFDVIICTEVLEHVRAWREAIHNMKGVLRPGGFLIVTTRSKGHPYHGYPYDFWRFELDDFRRMFSDFEVSSLESDPTSPGVFIKARRPASWAEVELSSCALYSMVTRKPEVSVSELDIGILKLRHSTRRLLSSIVPAQAKVALRKLYPGVSRVWRE